MRESVVVLRIALSNGLTACAKEVVSKDIKTINAKAKENSEADVVKRLYDENFHNVLVISRIPLW